MRKLQQAVNNAVVHVTPPPDPPRINATRVIPIVTSVDIVYGSAQAITRNANGTCVLSVAPGKEASTTFKLKLRDLYTIYGSALNVTVPTTCELALHKISLWGPLPQQTQASVALGVNINTALRSMIQDQGAANARPRVGLSMPQVHWFNSGDADAISVEVYYGKANAPTAGMMLGVLHITCSMRPTY